MAIFFFFNMSLIKVETGYLHQETTSLLPSSFTLTLLMQRGNMVDELTWGLTTDGRNEKAQCQSHYTSLWKKERDTNQPLPARQGSWLHGEPSARFPPFHQLYSSSSNQLKDRDLICCHSSPACFFFLFFFRWQAEYASCCGVDVNQAREKNFKASKDSPLSRKAIIRN